MKKIANVLKKITIVAVLCLLVVNATATKAYKSHTASQQMLSCSAYDVSVCAKDDKPDPEPLERPLGDLGHY